MDGSKYFRQYREYLVGVKKLSDNTVDSYMRDLRQVTGYLDCSPEDAGPSMLSSYMEHLVNAGRSPSTCARNASSIKSFYSYLLKQGLITRNPAAGISVGKHEQRLPEILDSREIELLLQQPRRADAKGMRDAAMLELIYATGVRVSELVDLRLADFDATGSRIRCVQREKERYLPLNPYVAAAMNQYVNCARPVLTAKGNNDSLFVNVSGKRLSRQGFWKIVKHYQTQANIEKDITPQVLRRSFAAHLLEYGAGLHEVQVMLGHSHTSSTTYYSKLISSSSKMNSPAGRI